MPAVFCATVPNGLQYPQPEICRKCNRLPTATYCHERLTNGASWGCLRRLPRMFIPRFASNRTFEQAL